MRENHLAVLGSLLGLWRRLGADADPLLTRGLGARMCPRSLTLEVEKLLHAVGGDSGWKLRPARARASRHSTGQAERTSPLRMNSTSFTMS